MLSHSSNAGTNPRLDEHQLEQEEVREVCLEYVFLRILKSIASGETHNGMTHQMLTAM